MGRWTSPQLSARDSGIRARVIGFEASRNPYPDPRGGFTAAWLEGWALADAVLRHLEARGPNDPPLLILAGRYNEFSWLMSALCVPPSKVDRIAKFIGDGLDILPHGGASFCVFGSWRERWDLAEVMAFLRAKGCVNLMA